MRVICIRGLPVGRLIALIAFLSARESSAFQRRQHGQRHDRATFSSAIPNTSSKFSAQSSVKSSAVSTTVIHAGFFRDGGSRGQRRQPSSSSDEANKITASTNKNWNSTNAAEETHFKIVPQRLRDKLREASSLIRLQVTRP